MGNWVTKATTKNKTKQCRTTKCNRVTKRDRQSTAERAELERLKEDIQ